MGILSRFVGSESLEKRAVEILEELMRRGQLKILISIKTPPCTVQVNALEVRRRNTRSYTMSEIEAEGSFGVMQNKKGGEVEIQASGQFRLLPEAEQIAMDQ
jgi:hypothetical protein